MYGSNEYIDPISLYAIFSLVSKYSFLYKLFVFLLLLFTLNVLLSKFVFEQFFRSAKMYYNPFFFKYFDIFASKRRNWLFLELFFFKTKMRVNIRMVITSLSKNKIPIHLGSCFFKLNFDISDLFKQLIKILFYFSELGIIILQWI